MKNYYNIQKVAKFQIVDFNDRNIVNEKIRYLQLCVTRLQYLKKFVVQNADLAQRQILKMIQDKRMSSYPSILQALRYASFKSRDSYKIFSQTCIFASDLIRGKIIQLKQLRKKFVNVYLPNKFKQYRKDK